MLLGWIGEEADEAGGKILGVAGFVKLNRHPFAVGHLAKILKIGTHDGNAVSASQVRNSAATGRRRVGHHSNRRTLKEIGQSILMNIAGEFNSRISRILFLHRLDVAGSLRMVSSANHQPGIGQNLRNTAKGFDHQFQPLVCSPLPEGQNAVLRIAAPGKIRILRFSGKNAMGAQVNIVATIFFVKYLAISRHEHRNGIRQKQHLGGDSSRQTVGTRMANTSVFQIYGVHQMMQGDVGIATGQTGKNRREKPGKSDQWIAPESAEEKIKPNHVRFEFADRIQNVN